MSNPPSTVGFGTRFFVILLQRCLAEYLRHFVTIDPDLPTGVKTALQTLIDSLPTLLALNEPGPE